MDSNRLSDAVAGYMQSLFQHRLASATKCPSRPPKPEPLMELSLTLTAACQSAVDMIITALLNIGNLLHFT